MFLYDGAALTPFRTDADTALKSGQLYRGIQLSDGVFGFTTTSAGVFMLDHVGHRVMTLDTGNGLPSNSVYYALRDRDGALWLGLDNGVARIETPSPVSYFDRARRDHRRDAGGPALPGPHVPTAPRRVSSTWFRKRPTEQCGPTSSTSLDQADSAGRSRR